MNEMNTNELKHNRSYCIGIIYEEADTGFLHNYFAPLMDSIRATAECSGYNLLFLGKSIGNEQLGYLEVAKRRNVDGVILVSCDFFGNDIDELIRSDIPCVTIDHVFHFRDCVLSANRQAMSILMRRIMDLGHKKIAFIMGTDEETCRIRRAGFLRAIADEDIRIGDEYFISESYHNPEAAYKATSKLLDLPEPPTCILMPDDLSAMGGIRAIFDRGLKIPEDISVVGFDGAPLFQMLQPKLTTLRQDTGSMGRIAAEKLIEIIEKPEMHIPEYISIPGTLLEGETLGKCKDIGADPE